MPEKGAIIWRRKYEDDGNQVHFLTSLIMALSTEFEFLVTIAFHFGMQSSNHIQCFFIRSFVQFTGYTRNATVLTTDHLCRIAFKRHLFLLDLLADTR